MGLCTVQNLLRCTHLVQFFEHKRAGGIVYAGGQLSVGKGARTARAELNIRIGIKLSLTVKTLHRRRSAIHVCAALKHDRRIAVLRQKQRAEHPRRAESYDYGSCAHFFASLLCRDLGLRQQCAVQPFQGLGGQGKVVFALAQDRANKQNSVVFSRVDRPFIKTECEVGTVKSRLRNTPPSRLKYLRIVGFKRNFYVV